MYIFVIFNMYWFRVNLFKMTFNSHSRQPHPSHHVVRQRHPIREHEGPEVCEQTEETVGDQDLPGASGEDRLHGRAGKTNIFLERVEKADYMVVQVRPRSSWSEWRRQTTWSCR